MECFRFWDPDIPREWRSAMNHMFHKGQMIAVKGEACRVPATESPSALGPHVFAFAI